MKLHIQQINEGEDEIILKYHKMTHEISDIIQYLNTDTQKIIGSYDNQIYHVPLRDIYYFESVDANTYAYTKDKILKVSNTLQQLQISLANSSFFRCSKSMILNIYQIESLKSESGNRINATLTNQEHVMISRKYAKDLRQILRRNGENEDE